MTTPAVARRDLVVSGVVVLVLVAVNLGASLLRPPWWARALAGVGLLAVARLAGLTWAQLGLGRDRLGPGSRWALGAVGVVAVVYAVGVALPLSRPAFDDPRYDLPVPDALGTALVVIPFGTVVFEELAFRSVLWGVLSRHCRPWQVLVLTSALFGLWHAVPAARAGGALLAVGTVALTTVGGLVFGELRRRSGSVLASAGAHWATNSLGVLFGFAARSLDRGA
ncbi:CPBP family intramembrane glutamic endopeptidase [Geodermatophilus sp. SYSU D00815]